MRVCVVCKTNQGEDGVSFHNFPKDKKKLKLWQKNMKLLNWTPKPEDLLCSKHFTKSCFIKYGTWTGLKKCSIPTLYFDSFYYAHAYVNNQISFLPDSERIKLNEDRTFVKQHDQSSIPGDVKPNISITYTKNTGTQINQANAFGNQKPFNENDVPYKYLKPMIPDIGINRNETSISVKQNDPNSTDESSIPEDVKPNISITYTKNTGAKRNQANAFGNQDPSNENDVPYKYLKPMIPDNGINRNEISISVKQDDPNSIDVPYKYLKPIPDNGININETSISVKQDDPNSIDVPYKYLKPIPDNGININETSISVKQDDPNSTDVPYKYLKPIPDNGINRNETSISVKQDDSNSIDVPYKYLKPIPDNGININETSLSVKQDDPNSIDPTSNDTIQCETLNESNTLENILASILHDHPYDISLNPSTDLQEAERASTLSLESQSLKQQENERKSPTTVKPTLNIPKTNLKTKKPIIRLNKVEPKQSLNPENSKLWLLAYVCVNLEKPKLCNSEITEEPKLCNKENSELCNTDNTEEGNLCNTEITEDANVCNTENTDDTDLCNTENKKNPQLCNTKKADKSKFKKLEKIVVYSK